MPGYQVGKDKAEKYVFQLCKELKLPVPREKDLRNIIRITSEEKVTEINLPKEIELGAALLRRP